MKDFIEKTNVTADLNQMLSDMEAIINQVGWPRKMYEGKTLSSNQIGLNHRPNAEDQCLDNVGSLFMQTVAKETDFTEWNDLLGDYTRSAIEKLAKEENFTLGRARYMLLPEKQGLTIHTDMEIRYHYVLKTNKNCLFGETVEGPHRAVCYNLPADGFFYRVDTTREHFVYNGSREPRIHLVICLG